MDIRTTLYSIALFFAGASGQLLVAQELPKVVPPSPEAASVFKFTEVPVSLYTGVPNITIPIYEIEANGLTVPISISYHSRGIQVSEIASRIGLGWSFNYGGMVSRQIRGVNDYKGTYGFLQVDSNSEDYFNNPTARENLLADNYLSEYDFIPDQYFFDANGINGKFILDKFNGAKPLVQHFSDIKVAGNSSGWEITDNRGNRYSFNATEYESTLKAYEASELNSSYTVTSTDLPESETSSWLISKIITAHNDTIDYVYEDTKETTQFFRRSHDAKQLFPQPNGQYPIAQGNNYSCHFSEARGYNSRLKRINFSKGHMLFSYEPRDDLYGSGCLKNIKVYNKMGQKVKEMHFEYEYTVVPYDPNHYSINQFLNGLDNNYARKRLFLKSVQVLANSGPEIVPSYRFEYDSIPLPNRHSNAQDFWGNYNGKNNGQYLKFVSPVIGVKSVDTIKSGAGMLKKIIYPEGGSTTFTYEHNKVKNLAFPSHYIPTTVNPSSVRDVYMGLLDTIYHTSDGKFSRMFTVGENVIGHIKTDIDLFGNDSGCGTSPDNHITTQCRFVINIYKNGQIHRTLFKGVNQTTLEPGEYQLRVKVIPISGAFDLFDAVNNSFNVHLNWLELAAQNDSLIYAGGKRIKKIEYHDEHNNLGLSKTYSYDNPATGATSGQLLGVTNYRAKNASLPGWPLILEYYGCVPGGPLQTYQGNSLGYQTVTEYYGEGTTTIGKTEHHFSMVLDGGTYYKFPYHPPTDNEWLRGKEVLTRHFKLENGIYKKVREIDTKYVYGDHIISNPDGDPNDPLDVASTPAAFTPFIPYSFGEMTKLLNENFEEPIIYYDKTRTFFQMPLTIFAKYKDIYEPVAGANQWDNSLNETMGYKTYFLNGGTVDLLTTKTTDFFDDGSSMAVRVNNGYHYAKHYNLANTRQYASDGSLKYVHYIYPQSVQMEGNPIALEMIAKNMVGIPLRTQISDDSSVPIGSTLTTQETQYKNWGNDLLAPEIIRTSKGTTTPEIRIRYNAVDNTTGNPFEVEQEGGIKISYIWGHNKTLPLAKIENMAYASIPASRITAIVDASNAIPYSEANLLTALNNLRTDAALANAMVTTYTYIPLVGVTSITDPKGDKITYEYDTFNRLKLVRDKDNNILSENHYHYRTQN